MKYYYKALDKVIQYLGKSKKVPSSCVEITKADYDKYLAITRSIENKEGYQTILTLYTDFTYEVDYIKEENSNEELTED